GEYFCSQDPHQRRSVRLSFRGRVAAGSGVLPADGNRRRGAVGSRPRLSAGCTPLVSTGRVGGSLRYIYTKSSPLQLLRCSPAALRAPPAILRQSANKAPFTYRR